MDQSELAVPSNDRGRVSSAHRSKMYLSQQHTYHFHSHSHTASPSSHPDSPVNLNTNTSLVDVIIKYTDLRATQAGQESLQPFNLLRSILNELRIYTGPLRRLQGGVIPVLIGAWVKGPEVIIILEDVGEGLGGLGDRWSDLSYRDR